MPARLNSRREIAGAGYRRSALWLLLWTLLFGAFPGHTDIQEPATSKGKGARTLQHREQPANGVEQTVTIDQGATVEVTLQARGQLGKWVDFIIRSQPEHGSLSGQRQLTRNSAAITYVHRAEDGPGTDTFTYSVQAPGSAVSAPVPVKIEIRDTPPDIVAAPAELDFGTVPVGDTSGASLELENRGGGEAVGRVELPQPWTVEGSPDYRLKRGDHQSFHIIFAPKKGRSFSETAALLGAAGPPTHLLGTGLGPPGESEAIAAASGPVDVNADRAAAAPARENAPPAKSPAVARAPVGVLAGLPRPPPNPGNTTDPLQGIEVPAEPVAPEPVGIPLDYSGFITPYDTGVKEIQWRGASRTTLDISWKPMVPAPKVYRVELRYLTVDEEKLRIDWRPYAQVDVRLGQDLCTATIRGLPAGVRQTMRVVALDAANRVAGASASLQATTLPPVTFWNLTPLKVLATLLLLCAAFVWRKRRQDRQILREIDESGAASREVIHRG